MVSLTASRINPEPLITCLCSHVLVFILRPPNLKEANLKKDLKSFEEGMRNSGMFGPPQSQNTKTDIRDLPLWACSDLGEGQTRRQFLGKEVAWENIRRSWASSVSVIITYRCVAFIMPHYDSYALMLIYTMLSYLNACTMSIRCCLSLAAMLHVCWFTVCCKRPILCSLTLTEVLPSSSHTMTAMHLCYGVNRPVPYYYDLTWLWIGVMPPLPPIIKDDYWLYSVLFLLHHIHNLPLCIY